MTAAATVLDVVLGLGILAVAALVLFLPSRSTAVVLFLVFGILLAILWARLSAPDIALAEAILGAGVTGALLIDAVTARSAAAKAPDAAGGSASRVVTPMIGGLAGAVAGVALMAAVLALDAPTARLGTAVRENLKATGVEHPVTAVLLNIRSLDTLLEVAVLVVAVLGALALKPGDEASAIPRAPLAMDGLVRMLVPMLVLLAGWILIAGTTRPGGAFQSGALMAAGLILIYLAGHPQVVPTGRILLPAVLAGLAGFLAVAFGTALAGDGWLALHHGWAGTAVLGIEIVVALSIGFTLAALFVTNRMSDAHDRPGAPADREGTRQ